MRKKRLVMPNQTYLADGNGELLRVFEENTIVDIIENPEDQDIVYFNKKKLFNKFMLDQTDNLLKFLNFNEIGRLLILSKYVRYRNCALAHPNGKPLTKECMADVFGENTRTIERLLNTFVKKEVLKKDCLKGVKFYRLNPFIFSRGPKIDRDVYDMFKTTKWFQADLLSQDLATNLYNN